MEHTLAYVIGKTVATSAVPLAAAHVFFGTPTRKAAEKFKGPTARYFKKEKGVFFDEELPTNVKPKYHKIERSKWLATSSYEPEQISKRTEYSDELKHTFNNLSGSVHSAHVYPDNKALYKRLVEGESMPSQWGGLGDSGRTDGMSKYGGKRPVSADMLLAGMRMSPCCVKLHQKYYNIPDDKIAMLGSAKFLRYLGDNHPDGRGVNVLGLGLVTSFQTAANTMVMIRPLAQKTKDNGEEHKPTDNGWTLSFEGTGRSRYKVPNPVRGINTSEDTLSEHYHVVLNQRVYNGTQRNTGGTLNNVRTMLYSSLQEAIWEAESMGFNWYVESDKSNAFPASRHPLYAANFPYRGCTKKRLGEKGAKRQKGGDAPRVVEWDPTIENHFEGKSKEDVFYA